LAVQPCAAHAVAFENMGEAALDDLATFAHHLLADSRVSIGCGWHRANEASGWDTRGSGSQSAATSSTVKEM
jgi:hypothetical protein